MIRKYHNHTAQTKPRHREEELQITDCHKTSGFKGCDIFVTNFVRGRMLYFLSHIHLNTWKCNVCSINLKTKVLSLHRI